MSWNQTPLLKASSLRFRWSMLSKAPLLMKYVVFYRRSRRVRIESQFFISLTKIYRNHSKFKQTTLETHVCRFDIINLIGQIYTCMKQSEKCWRIRKLGQTPQTTLSKVQKRQIRRARHANQQLLIIQCIRCKLALHRSYESSKGRQNFNPSKQEVVELSRINVRANKQEIAIFCGKCRNRVATVNQSNSIKMVLQAVTMQIPQAPSSPSLAASTRSPYDMLGALSGLSYRNTMGELYRLAYTKQSRYTLLLRELDEKCKNAQKKAKGLYNLIILTENNKEKNRMKSETSKIQYDRMMRSTTVDHSNSHDYSLQRKKDASLPR